MCVVINNRDVTVCDAICPQTGILQGGKVVGMAMEDQTFLVTTQLILLIG